MKATSYTIKGEKKEEVVLPKVFGETVNKYLLSQAVRVYEDRQHAGLARAKTRGDVNISTKKIYKQKGTGGARHGAKGAPIFVGGGVAHGPTGVKRVLTLSDSLRKQALSAALTLKGLMKKVVVLEDLDKVKKTKEISAAISKVSEKKNAKILIVLAKDNAMQAKLIRNIKNVAVSTFENLNAYDVLNSTVVIFDNTLVAAKEVKKEEVKIKKETKK